MARKNNSDALNGAGYTVSNVAIYSTSYVAVHFIRRVEGGVIEHVIRRVVRHVVCAVAGCVVGPLCGWLFWRRWGRGLLHHGPVLWRARAAHQAEKWGAIPKALGHAGGEEPPTWVAELVEDQHEKDGDGVGYQQLQHQQRGTDELVDVCFIDVPEQEQRGIFHKTQHVVHGHAIPVLGLVDEVWVTEFHLHGRPAEHVDASVEEREHAKHDGGSHSGQSFFYILRERGVALPEQDPGVEEENEEVQQNHGQDPKLEHRTEQDQNHNASGDLKASPQEYANISHRPDVHFIVIIFDLDGQYVAAQGSIHNGQEGDHHQCAWHADRDRVIFLKKLEKIKQTNLPINQWKHVSSLGYFAAHSM